MTAIETREQSSEFYTKPFDGHKYCVDIYIKKRMLPPIFQTYENGEVRTKVKHERGDRHVRNVDITKFYNKLSEEAAVMASSGLEQFKREHPNMDDEQSMIFGGMIYEFAIYSGLLSKKDGSSVIQMSDLTPNEFAETVTSLSNMLPSVIDERIESRKAKEALMPLQGVWSETRAAA